MPVNMEQVKNFLKIHPALLITGFTLTVASFGFLSEYSLLQHFGLNIGSYASLDHFLVVGLSSPVIVVSFVSLCMFFLTMLGVIDGLFEQSKTLKHHTTWRFVIVLTIYVIVCFNIFEQQGKAHSSIVLSPSSYSIVEVRGDYHQSLRKPKDLTVITVTNSFMVFYQHSTSSTIALPIENILSVQTFRE